jgi:hypothetical protein
MSQSASKITGHARSSAPLNVPPAIRLVLAFKEAMESSRRAQNPSDESFVVEGLLIAANASFSALSQFADLWHEGTYGESPSDEAGEEQPILDGYEVWRDAAGPLLVRLRRLTEVALSGQFASYQSEGAVLFETHCHDAMAVLNDTLSRRQAEQEALHADQLAELAAKLKPRRASYDDEGTSP